MDAINRRILIIDDMPEIHGDYRQVLSASVETSAADSLAADILGSDAAESVEKPDFIIDSASQGEEGLRMVERALAEGEPYAAAFVDVRMPPGWDGIETIKQIWQVDPDIQVTIVTAYSDYSWDHVAKALGATDQLLVLKKPFESIELLQIACALTQKWDLMHRVKKQEAALRKKNSELKQQRDFSDGMINTVQTIILLLNRDGTIEFINPYMEALIGYELDEVKGKDWFDTFLPGEDREKMRSIFLQAVDNIQTKGNRNIIVARDGREILVEWYDKTVKCQNGETVGVLAAGQDVTHQQLAEEAVRQSQERFRQVVEQASDGIFIADINGQYIDVNSAGCMMLGFERDEIIGKTIVDLIPPEDAHRLLASKDAMLEGGSNISEWRLRKKDGAFLPVEVSANILPDGQWQGFVRDITERKKAEASIHKFSQAIEQSGEAIAITDALGVIEYINPAFSQLTGYSEAEAIGQTHQLLKSDSQHMSVYKQLWHKILSGETWQGKIINQDKAGNPYPAILTISPIRNDDGEVTNYIGIQQSLKEYEELEEKFHQSQKMEAIGTLVGGIAHDFNNSLAGITGNLYLAKKAAKDFPEIVSRLETIEKLSFRSAATIQQLLTFSRKGLVKMQPLSITSLLKESTKLQQVSLPENINFKLELHGVDISTMVNGDVNQLQQILMNLINNAFDAVEGSDQPSIAIQCDRFHADSHFIDAHEDLKEGEYVCISVRDNGLGIKNEHIEHVFEPFFTTKEQGKGTGLGLAMVYGAVHSHGGVIDLSSSQTPPSGTEAKVYLPIISATPGIDPDHTDEQVVEGHGETILLVDDDAVVLETGKAVLEGLGYEVLTAEDGMIAVEQYRRFAEEIDLIIFDVVMPRQGGVEALQEIRAINPAIKAIFATGYDKLSKLGTRKYAGSERVISKPFAISMLSQVVREVLDE